MLSPASSDARRLLHSLSCSLFLPCRISSAIHPSIILAIRAFPTHQINQLVSIEFIRVPHKHSICFVALVRMKHSAATTGKQENNLLIEFRPNRDAGVTYTLLINGGSSNPTYHLLSQHSGNDSRRSRLRRTSWRSHESNSIGYCRGSTSALAASASTKALEVVVVAAALAPAAVATGGGAFGAGASLH